jgi:hypothetical protein
MTAPYKPRANKFNARKTTAFGRVFASRKEAMRFVLLRQWERDGKIIGLTCQPKFNLVVNGDKVGSYRPDFGYTENGAAVVEDVKSVATKTEASQLRMKVFRACYPGVELRVVA